MSASEDLVASCLVAVEDDRAMSAVKEIVERAVRDDRHRAELSEEPGIRVLHGTDDLTIAHVVISRHRAIAPRPVAHDHRMWAVIGMVHGSEDNEFCRRSDQTIVPSGTQVLNEGDVPGLGRETIHAVHEPCKRLAEQRPARLRGDLFGIERSMWCEPDWSEQPHDLERVTGRK